MDDLISRQAVLKIIDGWHENNRDIENIEDLIILITYMASIKPQAQEPCEDAISRQAAIDAIWDGVNMDIYTREVKECLEELPSVSTEKTGRWKWVQYSFDPRIGNWHCSECRNIVIQGVEKKGLHKEVIYKFCPWCGARMIKPQESEDYN